VQAVEQVAPGILFFLDPPRIRSRLVAAISRTSTRIVLRAPQVLELLVLQNAQQFGLQLQRNLSNLVEQQSALIRQFQPARASGLTAPVNASLFVAEQLAFPAVL